VLLAGIVLLVCYAATKIPHIDVFRSAVIGAVAGALSILLGRPLVVLVGRIGMNSNGPSDRRKGYRQYDWPRYLKEVEPDSPGGRERLAEFNEYRTLAADRQASALVRATGVLAATTFLLLLATLALVYVTAHHASQ
jgi:hypothetical protein